MFMPLVFTDEDKEKDTENLFNGLSSRTTWVSWHQKRKPF